MTAPASDLHDEVDKAKDRTSPSGSVVHDAICREGEEELSRTTKALAWSGLAAGLSMGFSLMAQGVLRAHLPDAEWQPLIASFGYSIGFLVVVLGRQQLFTENTLTVMLPLFLLKDGETLRGVLRVWVAVLLANLAGALIFALVVAHTPLFDEHVVKEFVHVGQEALRGDFGTTLLRGIVAGWLIALMVWLLPFAGTARFFVIVVISWLIAAGGLTHVVAGSIDVFFLAARGEISWVYAIGSYTIPSLLGNILGGVGLVAALNHAQVVAK